MHSNIILAYQPANTEVDILHLILFETSYYGDEEGLTSRGQCKQILKIVLFIVVTVVRWNY